MSGHEKMLVGIVISDLRWLKRLHGNCVSWIFLGELDTFAVPNSFLNGDYVRALLLMLYSLPVNNMIKGSESFPTNSWIRAFFVFSKVMSLCSTPRQRNLFVSKAASY